MNFRLLFSLVLMSALGACAPKQSDRYQTHGRSFWDIFSGRSDYEVLFDERTIEERTHSEFESIMTAYITSWDRELQRAYVEEMKAQFRFPPEQEKALAKEQAVESKKFIVFIFSVATREPAWADFHKKNSMWRITLENEDSSIQVDPDSVELIAARDEKAKYFYRHMSTFTTTYKVRFLRKAYEPVNGFFHITGPRGALKAKFSIDAPPADR